MTTRFAKTATRLLISLAIALTCAMCAGLVFSPSAFAASSVPTATKAGWTKGADGNRYYFKSAGSKPAKGWLKVNGSKYYLDPAKNGAMVRGRFKVGNSWYAFSSSGSMITNGWARVGTARYYASASGALKTGWVKVGKSWYYLDPAKDGARVVGKWKKIDGAWYYLTSSGAMKTGWLKQGSKWYYLGSDGAKKTGWARVKGVWYYLDPSKSGVMTKSKWMKVGASRYYFTKSGAMKTGWLKYKSKWYYLGSDGAKRTKWQKIKGSWYYLGSDGAMWTGWQEIGGKIYYLQKSGVMKTGWTRYGHYRYYLGSDGAMLCNTKRLIGGTVYAFDELGANCSVAMLHVKIDLREWVKHARQSLGVPKRSNITFSIDGSKRVPVTFTNPNSVKLSGWGTLWEGGGMYTRRITFYENGKFCAAATCEADTGYPERSMFGYTRPGSW